METTLKIIARIIERKTQYTIIFGRNQNKNDNVQWVSLEYFRILL